MPTNIKSIVIIKAFQKYELPAVGWYIMHPNPNPNFFWIEGPCNSNPCHNGICAQVDDVGRYKCDCTAGYIGFYCEFDSKLINFKPN